MIGSIPAPRSLLTVCPSTFAAACLVVGCRRTFLGLLAVLSAALPTVFAALKGWTRSRGAVYLFSLMLFLPSNTDAQAQTAPEITSGGPFAVAEGTTAVAAGSGHKVDGVKPELSVTDGVSIEANRLSLNADPVLWYAMPAASWNEALPVGNGRLAGMVFGNTGRERIQLNEDTLWAGAPRQGADAVGGRRGGGWWAAARRPPGDAVPVTRRFAKHTSPITARSSTGCGWNSVVRSGAASRPIRDCASSGREGRIPTSRRCTSSSDAIC